MYPTPSTGAGQKGRPYTPAVDGVAFNPFAPGFFADPYAQYAELREHAPVHELPFGPWMLMRYEDCARLLRDPRGSVEERKAGLDRRALLFGPDDPRRHRGATGILNIDPPDHTRIRRLVGSAFTPRRVVMLGARIQQLVDEFLDQVEPAGEMDVIAELAFPLPFAVISELLGMPDTESREELRDVSHTLVRSLEPLTDPGDAPLIRDASDAMAAHVSDAIEWKRAHPSDDLLSALIAAEADGETLSPEELHDQVSLLFIAGHETTVNLIGNGTNALLRNPEQLARLRDEPSLANNTVEELLRFDGPVQFSRRVLLHDVEIDDCEIPAESIVLAGLGAANHDPAHFGPDADALDITRPLAVQHLSFGGGIHHCVGAVLARAEARAAIGTLVARFPRLALATDEPAWNGRLVLRGIDELPVTLA
jgi:cytochrome P450